MKKISEKKLNELLIEDCKSHAPYQWDDISCRLEPGQKSPHSNSLIQRFIFLHPIIAIPIVIAALIIFICLSLYFMNNHIIKTYKGLILSMDSNSSNAVVSVTRIGGLPSVEWKELTAPKDYSTINKIVNLVNSTKKTGFEAKNYGSGSVGYPVSIEIKLKNNAKWIILPVFNISTRTLEDGSTESTAAPYKDRVELLIENGKKTSYYTLFSEQLADYVLNGASKDMPNFRAYSAAPDTI